MQEFAATYGFARGAVHLGNWRTLPYSRYAFQRTRELVPTAEITCGIERPEEPAGDFDALAGTALNIAGGKQTVREFLATSGTDVFVAMKNGAIVAEWAAPHAEPASAHILFSITKSVTGLLAGILEDEGCVDPARPVADYCPETAQCGFGTARVRDLLDMRVSLDFDESYLDTSGDYARYRRAMGWNPPDPAAPAETLGEFLLSIPKGARDHGGPFRYVSPASDMLGLVLERATGVDYATLVSERVWRPLGAHRHACVTLDAAGAARGAGGMCATARDLARLGDMLRRGGESPRGRVVSPRWVDDMRENGDRRAWRGGEFADFLPGGRYRAGWYQTGFDSEAFCAIGIHGQWLYVDPSANVVLVKLSAQALPLDEAQDARCLAFFRALCRAL